MRPVVVLHNRVAEDAPIDDRDVLDQSRDVAGALRDLGYEPLEMEFTGDLHAVAERLRRIDPLFVFNLTESLDGNSRMIFLAPALLEHLDVPYTGCSHDALYITSNKLLAKKMMHAVGVDTPHWMGVNGDRRRPRRIAGHYIFKSVWDHGSSWFDENSILYLERSADIHRHLRDRLQRSGKEFIAARYIDGREFHVSLLAGRHLGASEIIFENYPVDKFKVYNYQAKWVRDTFEYSHAYHVFEHNRSDRPLLERLRRIAEKCWRSFDLRGYARFDFRIDSGNRPWLLEINANPCITRESIFAAAAETAGLSYTEAIDHIIRDSVPSSVLAGTVGG